MMKFCDTLDFSNNNAIFTFLLFSHSTTVTITMRCLPNLVLVYNIGPPSDLTRVTHDQVGIEVNRVKTKTFLDICSIALINIKSTEYRLSNSCSDKA